MDKKRKSKDFDEEKIKRKIRKLEKKLHKSTEDSQDKESIEPNNDIINEDLDSIYMPPTEWTGSVTNTPQNNDTLWDTQDFLLHNLPLPQETENCIIDIVSPQPTGNASPQPGPSSASSAPIELDETILNILGEAPKANTKFGPKIHPDIASRWQEILSNGLPKADKEKLMTEYLIPENCDLLVPPILNPEIKVALSDYQVKRDTSIITRQIYMATALSALAQVTDMIIHNDISPPKLLKPIIDATRLLCDNHNYETRVRRNFTISAIDNSIKDSLIESKRDSFLFGENLGEKLKMAKTIQRSGETLKNQNRPTFYQNNHLNYRPLHQKPRGRFDAGQTRLAPRALPPHRHQMPPPMRPQGRPLPSQPGKQPSPLMYRNHPRR